MPITGCGNNTARLYTSSQGRFYSHRGSREPPPPTHTAASAVERLMVLDAVLAERQIEWLGTEHDKVGTSTLGGEFHRPHCGMTFRSGTSATVRYFTDKLPIGISADGRHHVFLYLATRPMPLEFRLFVERHAEICCGTLPEWTPTTVGSPTSDQCRRRYQQGISRARRRGPARADGR